MQDPEGLRVYQAAKRLALEVYRVLPSLPLEERFELGEQLRSASVSVGSNIAEGCGRTTPKDFCSFLDRALGSLRELSFQLQHCESLSLTTAATTRRALETARCTERMLTALIVKIRRSNGL